MNIKLYIGVAKAQFLEYTLAYALGYNLIGEPKSDSEADQMSSVYLLVIYSGKG